jgi:hypothetical protein
MKRLPFVFFTIYSFFAYSQTPVTNYCLSKGNTPWEQWIETITVKSPGSNDFIKTSFKDGYANFTSPVINVIRGSLVNFTLKPNSSWLGDPRNSNFFYRVYIDLDNNKSFNSNTELFVSKQIDFFAQDNKASFTIPISQNIGQVRMRVSMKLGSYPTPCEIFDRGEVEDYTLNIIDASNNNCPPQYYAVPLSSTSLSSPCTSVAVDSATTANRFTVYQRTTNPLDGFDVVGRIDNFGGSTFYTLFLRNGTSTPPSGFPTLGCIGASGNKIYFRNVTGSLRFTSRGGSSGAATAITTGNFVIFQGAIGQTNSLWAGFTDINNGFGISALTSKSNCLNCRNDVTAPVFQNCKKDTTITIIPPVLSSCFVVNFPTAVDNCSPYVSTSSNFISTGYCLRAGQSRTFSTVATDPNGNSATCSYTVRVDSTNNCPPQFEALPLSQSSLINPCSTATIESNISTTSRFTVYQRTNNPLDGYAFDIVGRIDRLTGSSFYTLYLRNGTSTPPSGFPSLGCTDFSVNKIYFRNVTGSLQTTSRQASLASAITSGNFVIFQGAIGSTNSLWAGFSDIDNGFGIVALTSQSNCLNCGNDVTAPVFTNCRKDTTLTITAPDLFACFFPSFPNAVDNCSPYFSSSSNFNGGAKVCLQAGESRAFSTIVTDPNGNSNTCSYTVRAENGSSKPDIELSLAASNTAPPKYSVVDFTVTVRNKGASNSGRLKIPILLCKNGAATTFIQTPNNLVYAGAPTNPVIGIFEQVNQVWELPNLAPGAAASFTIKTFTLTGKEVNMVAFVSSQENADFDSNPSSGVPNCAPSEDDEALVALNRTSSRPGLEEFSTSGKWGDDELLIFPNPAQDYINIDLRNYQNQSINLKIFNILGVQMDQISFDESHSSIQNLDIQKLSVGSYYLYIETKDEKRQVIRFVKSLGN